MSGFFEIGTFRGKTTNNLGTLWRSAYQLGAAGIFTIGGRYRRQASDTLNAAGNIPLRQFETFEQWLDQRPHSAPLVGIEMGGVSLEGFAHPKTAIYLLGAEDDGLPPSILRQCQHVVSLPSVRVASFNVAVAGSLVMFHRLTSRRLPRIPA